MLIFINVAKYDHGISKTILLLIAGVMDNIKHSQLIWFDIALNFDFKVFVFGAQNR